MQFPTVPAVLALASTALAAPSVGPAAGLQIEKRATCSVPIYGEGLCIIHCLAENYCDSYCTSKNICTCEGKKGEGASC